MALFHLSHGRTFDDCTGEVQVDGRVVRLEPQPAALLALLLARPATLVAHDEIRRHLWDDGRHVDYAANVHYAVRRIRQALSVGGATPDIETVPRRGYRLRAGALECDVPSTSGGATAPRPRLLRSAPGVPRRRLLVGMALAAAVAGLVVAERRPNTHHESAVAVARAVHAMLYDRPSGR